MVDELGHNTSNGLNTLGKRSDIQKKEIRSSISAFSRKNSSLNGSPVGNSLIRVDSLGWFLTTKEFGNETLNLGDTGRSSNQNNFVNLRLLNISIVHNTSNGTQSL